MEQMRCIIAGDAEQKAHSSEDCKGVMEKGELWGVQASC